MTHPLLLHRYRIVSELGRGTFCTVFLLQDTLISQRLYACKVIPKKLCVILQNDFKTSHDTLLNYFYFEVHKFAFLIQERLVAIPPFLQLDGWQSRLGMLRKAIMDVANCLSRLHTSGYVHADIKRSNLMYRPAFGTQVVLIDYGNSISISALQVLSDSEIVSPLYRAPEILSNSHALSPAIDIWAFGIVLIELAHCHPFQSYSRLLEYIQGTLGLPKPQVRLQLMYWTNINDSLFIDLLERMLRLDPRERITAEQICDHPFLDLFIK